MVSLFVVKLGTSISTSISMQTECEYCTSVPGASKSYLKIEKVRIWNEDCMYLGHRVGKRRCTTGSVKCISRNENGKTAYQEKK